MELNCIHRSLKPYCKPDSHGNDPFWIRCSTFGCLDAITDEFKPIRDVLELVIVKPFTFDIYELKQGYLCLKRGSNYCMYEFNDNFCDYDIQPYIDKGECWFKEIIQTQENS